MYENIGSKMKSIAKGLAIIGIVFSCISGIVFMFKMQLIVGLLIALLGSFASWFSSLTMYGIGELIVNSESLMSQSSKILALQKQQYNVTNALVKAVQTERDNTN